MKKWHLLLILGLWNSVVHAQNKKVAFNVRTGFAIGGASPIGFPESIRKIEKFNPGLLLSLEGGVAYNFSDQWAMASAVRFEQKGMTTESVVKNYFTVFNAGDHSGGESITGYYTGKVETSVKNTYLTIPLHMIRVWHSRISVKAGGFVSLLIEKRFTGSAHDGYLRNLTPVGEKEQIVEAAYDFSEQLRPLNTGVEAGADYRIGSNLAVSVNVSWGLTPLMKKDQQSIDFKLYNIFLNPGLTYRF